MKPGFLAFVMILCASPVVGQRAPVEKEGRHHVIFATFAESEEQRHHTLVLVESLRTFGGSYSKAPVWIYLSDRLEPRDDEVGRKLSALHAVVKTSKAPPEALRFYYGSKAFAAAKAEAEALGKTELLVWMDEDTVILEEPDELMLGKDASLGYCPVMHKNIGSDYSEPLDEFWSRLFEKLSVSQDAVFPMVTTASSEKIRPYFNAGILVVRPERRLMQTWAEYFPVLYGDPVFVGWAKKDIKKNIFLHQAALTGAILNVIPGKEMFKLSDRINYPLFFHEKWEATREFYSIDEATTIRYDVFLKDQPEDWIKKLKGSKEKIDWLKARFSSGKSP